MNTIKIINRLAAKRLFPLLVTLMAVGFIKAQNSQRDARTQAQWERQEKESSEGLYSVSSDRWSWNIQRASKWRNEEDRSEYNGGTQNWLNPNRQTFQQKRLRISPVDDQIQDSVRRKNFFDLAKTYYDIGVKRMSSGRYAEAETRFKYVQKIVSPDLELSDQEFYTQSSFQLANLYRKMGRFGLAIKTIREILGRENALASIASSEYTGFLRIAGSIYREIGELDTALIFVATATQLDSLSMNMEPWEVFWHECLADDYLEKGKIHVETDNIKLAIPSLYTAHDIARKIPKFTIEYPNYSEILRTLSRAHLRFGGGEKALDLLLIAQVVDSISRSANSFEFASDLIEIANVQLTIGNPAEAGTNLWRAFGVLRKMYFQNLDELSPEEQMIFHRFLILRIENAFSQFHRQNNIPGELFYDFALFTKGIGKRIECLKRQFLAGKERIPQNWFSKFGFADHFNVRWNNVQKALNQRSAAIEFVRTGSLRDDSAFYYAVLLRGRGLPLAIPLGKESNLKRQFGLNSAHLNRLRGVIPSAPGKAANHSTFEQFWLPFESELAGIDTLYYAPTGIFEQLSFEMLGYGEAMTISDKYWLVRMNSTQSLLSLRRNFEKEGRVSLFGGLEYSREANPKSGEDSAKANWSKLPGTLDEVNKISKIISSRGGRPAVFSNGAGNIPSLLSLQGKNCPSILHLATHGFYLEDIAHDIDPSFSNYYTSPLHRSGIILAPDSRGLGLLTANEVAKMHFPNLRLVVLSACQTGLGDVIGSEGVFGLGRAFQLAGAEYVMMSLWSIPDKETAEFMAQFYHYLYIHYDFQIAFRKAQNVMKEKYYNEPEKWAGFVLVR